MDSVAQSYLKPTTGGKPEKTSSAEPDSPAALRVALLGNPNTGKTTLFNRLSGLRHKTGNFPGTTQEARVGQVPAADGASAVQLVDLPGIYSLELNQSESEICRRVLDGSLAPPGLEAGAPSAICLVVDATNLGRNLLLVGEALRRRLPTVVALNMIDLFRRRGLHVDVEKLSERLGCRVVACSARSGEGLAEVRLAMSQAVVPNRTPPGTQEGLEKWSDEIFEYATASDEASALSPRESVVGVDSGPSLTDRLDRVFTQPVLGLVVFAAVMTGLFWVIFTAAHVPMDLIDLVFSRLSDFLKGALPDGVLSDLLANGIVRGVSATVIFLPQICLLFFLISLLEDTGYLARAAFVMDRMLRPFGLPGHSFMPLLSSHACALPGIMACRAIPDKRDRLATILVAPFMSCSARIPVYVLITLVLFHDRPLMQALAFVGCYGLGVVAALSTSLIFRRTILRGKSRPMALELPTYKKPSIQTALLTTYDRGLVFLKNAGTNIMAILIVLWWLGAYPKVDHPPKEIAAIRAQAEAARPAVDRAKLTDAEAEQYKARFENFDALTAEADRVAARYQKSQSFLGHIGRGIQPVLAPLGFDRQLSVGVLASFAAREVFVSTMAVVTTGEEDKEKEGVMDEIAAARRDDGTPIFTTATSWSLLIYYVLAMQCLPTLAVTAREAGGVKWALLQLAWMSGLAYIAAFAVFHALRATGVA
jgi:ferrous iron transport protein B